MIILVIDKETNFGGIKKWHNEICNQLKIMSLKFNTLAITGDMPDINNIYDSIIIANNVVSKYFYNGIILKKLQENKNKLYYVMHSNTNPTNKLLQIHSKYFYGIICISQGLIELLKTIAYLKDKKVAFIPNKINFIRNSSSKEVSKNIRLGFVGRISIEKNIPMLLHSIKNMVNLKFDNIKLNLFGSCKNQKYLDYILSLIKKLNLENVVNYAGHYENDEMEKMYNQIDILVLPSIAEGMPYCIIESSHYNIIPVLSNVGDINEIVNDINSNIFNLKGLKKYTGIYVNNYIELLRDVGYTEHFQQNNNNYTDAHIHTCENFELFCDCRIIPAIDYVSTQKATCKGCEVLIDKKKLFIDNVNLLTRALIDTINNIPKYKIIGIYKNVDMTNNLNALINDTLPVACNANIPDTAIGATINEPENKMTNLKCSYKEFNMGNAMKRGIHVIKFEDNNLELGNGNDYKNKNKYEINYYDSNITNMDYHKNKDKNNVINGRKKKINIANNSDISNTNYYKTENRPQNKLQHKIEDTKETENKIENIEITNKKYYKNETKANIVYLNPFSKNKTFVGLNDAQRKDKRINIVVGGNNNAKQKEVGKEVKDVKVVKVVKEVKNVNENPEVKVVKEIPEVKVAKETSEVNNIQSLKKKLTAVNVVSKMIINNETDERDSKQKNVVVNSFCFKF